jgi:hypothetical protein
VKGPGKHRRCKRDGCTAIPRSGRYYCTAHNPLRDPLWRAERGRLAGDAARLEHIQHAIDRTQGLDGKEAYQKGYKVGYTRAWRFWKVWADKAMRELHQRKVAASTTR